MTFFARNLTKLILVQPFYRFIILLGLGLSGVTALPSSACCYDPPDYDDTSEQVESLATESSGKVSQDSVVAPDVPEEAQPLLYSADSSDQQGQSSEGAGAGNFLLIRRFMADGQYLRAKQMAEKRVMTRPFDYQIWGLLETIYSKMGLQNKTSTAAKNAKLMNPRRRPPPKPSQPMSQQKRYVTKLLQAIGEYKPLE
mgnify:CR=1 FL=1